MASRRRTHCIARAVATVLAGLALAAPTATANPFGHIYGSAQESRARAASSTDHRARGEGIELARVAAVALLVCVALGEGGAFVRRRWTTRD